MKPLTKAERAILERMGEGSHIKVLDHGGIQYLWSGPLSPLEAHRMAPVKGRTLTPLMKAGFLSTTFCHINFTDPHGLPDFKMAALITLSDQGKLRLSMEVERDRVSGQIKARKAARP